MRATQQFITMPPALVISIWPAYSASRGLSSDGCRLKSGFELTTPIETLTLAGKTVFSIAEGQLLICLEKEITHDCIKAMAEKEPSRVICLDEAFTGTNADALKTNAVQIMKSKGVVNFRTV